MTKTVQIQHTKFHRHKSLKQWHKLKINTNIHYGYLKDLYNKKLNFKLKSSNPYLKKRKKRKKTKESKLYQIYVRLIEKEKQKSSVKLKV